ncbi:homeodomain protein class 2 [Vairimorpha ceranae]|uniref:Homeodomain protein class 2 n=1 Tax=Vairimorpha ceranae TaxID=40302 RepID=A0A0F9WAB7_9MICR|nr:homeodomain protein class 2 [Vairimorpha ceranae]KAF5140210.1 hypothetical protein G9O61_00g015970 [Vairimorpha ceranae]KKO73870.1 homeodomain protein class 2 [Vairimorpha ceranae]
MKHINTKLLAKINKFRILYIETNNKLCNSIEAVYKCFICCNKIIKPNISIQIKNVIQSELKKMQENTVDSISLAFESYFELLHRHLVKSNSNAPKRFSKNITDILEQSFKNSQYPSDFEKVQLADICNLSIKQVSNWFTNKRNRFKSYSKGFFYV